MIEMLEGVPGAGKSYYAVTERLLSWVRANRLVYVYVEGFYLDRLAMFEGRTIEELQKQITLWTTPDEVKSGLLQVEPGSAVLIDEVQTVFRSRGNVEPEILRMLETHRHKGIDIVMMCQQHGQVTLGVNRLVEVTTKFRRLDRFGLKNRYQAQVRGNPEETEVIRMFTGKYDPKNYAYYSSYSAAGVKEQVRKGSILKSPTVVIGLVGLVFAAWWFGGGTWLTPPADVAARTASLPPPPPFKQDEKENYVAVVQEIRPVRVEGGMLLDRQGVPTWLYVTESGRLLTDDQIANESGGTVNSRMESGVRRLYGTGVIWGGEHHESVAVSFEPTHQQVHQPANQQAVMPSIELQPVTVAPIVPNPNVKDLLVSPPDLR